MGVLQSGEFFSWAEGRECGGYGGPAFSPFGAVDKERAKQIGGYCRQQEFYYFDTEFAVLEAGEDGCIGPCKKESYCKTGEPIFKCH